MLASMLRKTVLEPINDQACLPQSPNPRRELRLSKSFGFQNRRLNRQRGIAEHQKTR